MKNRPTVEPTKRGKDVLDYIRRFTLIHQYQPDIRQIGIGTGIGTPQAVHKHLIKLQEAGWIEAGAGRARAVRLLHAGDAAIIDASGPIPADEPLVHDERLLDRVAPTIVQAFPEAHVFLKLADPGAAGAGPNDLIAVELLEDERPKAGTLVIIREGDHVVCRRLETSDRASQIEGVIVGSLAIRNIER